MSKGTLQVLVYALALSLIWQSPAAFCQSTQQDDLLKGIEYWKGAGTRSVFYYGKANPNLDEDMQILQNDGIHWVSIEFPVYPFDEDYTRILPALQSIAAHGMWASINLLCSKYDRSDTAARAKYKQWLSKAVQAWGSNVRMYEVGGEENLSQKEEQAGTYPYGWTGLPDNLLPNNNGGPCSDGPPPGYRPRVQDFVAFLKDSSDTIKQAKDLNPQPTVLIGGLSSFHCSCYLKVLTELKAYNFADGIGFHTYEGRPLWCAQDVSTYIQPVVAGWPKKLPIWITDWGWQARQPDGVGGVGLPATEDKVAKYVAEEYRLFRQMNNIDTPIFLYTAVDGYKAHVFGLFSREPDHGKVYRWPSYFSYKDPLRYSGP